MTMTKQFTILFILLSSYIGAEEITLSEIDKMVGATVYEIALNERKIGSKKRMIDNLRAKHDKALKYNKDVLAYNERASLLFAKGNNLILKYIRGENNKKYRDIIPRQKTMRNKLKLVRVYLKILRSISSKYIKINDLDINDQIKRNLLVKEIPKYQSVKSWRIVKNPGGRITKYLQNIKDYEAKIKGLQSKGYVIDLKKLNIFILKGLDKMKKDLSKNIKKLAIVEKSKLKSRDRKLKELLNKNNEIKKRIPIFEKAIEMVKQYESQEKYKLEKKVKMAKGDK